MNFLKMSKFIFSQSRAMNAFFILSLKKIVEEEKNKDVQTQGHTKTQVPVQTHPGAGAGPYLQQLGCAGPGLRVLVQRRLQEVSELQGPSNTVIARSSEEGNASNAPGSAQSHGGFVPVCI